MATSDPFERAAKREQLEEARREVRRAQMRKRYARGAEGSGKALGAFFLPYVVWALLRAPNHVWGEPSTGKAIVAFFFDTGWMFAWATAWVLFLAWVWMISDGD